MRTIVPHTADRTAHWHLLLTLKNNFGLKRVRVNPIFDQNWQVGLQRYELYQFSFAVTIHIKLNKQTNE